MAEPNLSQTLERVGFAEWLIIGCGLIVVILLLVWLVGNLYRQK